jgi:hypothetical protein
LEAEFVEFNKKLDSVMIQRRLKEAALLASQTDLLKIRSKAFRAEQRATELAHELSRLFRDMNHNVAAMCLQRSQELEAMAVRKMEYLKAANSQDFKMFMHPVELLQEVEEQESHEYKRTLQNSYCDQAGQFMGELRERTSDLLEDLESCNKHYGLLKTTWESVQRHHAENQKGGKNQRGQLLSGLSPKISVMGVPSDTDNEIYEACFRSSALLSKALMMVSNIKNCMETI